MTGRFRQRVFLFAGICLVCAAVAFGYALASVSRARAQVIDRVLPPASADAPPRVEPPPAEPVPAPPLPEPLEHEPGVRLIFRHTEVDRSFGAVAVEDVGGEGERRAAPLMCTRVYAAGGRGVCLTVDRIYATNSLLVFDERFEVVHRLPLAGLPSRARLSPDGRLAAATVFVYGHSYGDGDFSTETSIVDTRSGVSVIRNLQDLEVARGEARFHAVDFNFWGVTFAADSDRFFATLRTAGQTWLVEGRVSSRRMRVLRENVECPSLSPDDTRIAFKKRVSDDPASLWRLHVLDLATMAETPLADTRSVDDQVEWLDDDRVLYGVPRAGAPAGVGDVWVVPADGSGKPAIYLAGAASPAVQRLTLP